MKISIKVITKAAKEEVIRLYDKGLGYDYRIKVTCPAIKNMANNRVIELLAEYFKYPKSGIKIVKGLKSNIKTFEINE
jgi:uncharacterized protein YggU (UPF0235/DUF167 family)